MSCPIMSPKKNSKKYVKIVCPPMAKRPKYEPGSSPAIPENPPARAMLKGSRIRKMPTVITQNCRKSVRVMDHMPPRAE